MSGGMRPPDDGGDPGVAGAPAGNEATLDVLAGEYVLGLLDDGAARALEDRARQDPAAAAAIATWQARLDPLSDLPAPVPPSQALWSRIAADLKPAAAQPAPQARPQASAPTLNATTPNAAPQTAPPQTARPQTAASRIAARQTADVPASANPDSPGPARPGPWRALALASMALAAGLAAFIVWSRQPQPPAAPWPRAVALLSAPGSAAASLRAQVTGAGTITVVPLRHLDVAPDHRLGFWAWPASEKAPVLLGMIPAAGGQLRFPFPPREGTPVMVTLEGRQATADGKPGPTLYLGLLVAGPS